LYGGRLEVVGSEQDKEEKESYIGGLKNIRKGSGVIHDK
jgi:hypothetical protein